MTLSAKKPPSPAILLVDDDPDMRMVIRDVLETEAGVVEVHEATTGEEALDVLYRRGPHAQTPRPHLVYMDIQMPGMGGQAALSAIRRDPDLADIPVVMMTGLDDDGQKRLAAANGANSYTLKPVDPLALAENVRRVTAYWTAVHRRPESESCDE